MRERIKSVLISLWLLYSCPHNVYTLKSLIREGLIWWGFSAGLGYYLKLQFLLALVFVGIVSLMLLRGQKTGRTLAVVLLIGSCIQLVLISGIRCVQWRDYQPYLGSIIFYNGIVLLLNVLCLTLLFRGSAPREPKLK